MIRTKTDELEIRELCVRYAIRNQLPTEILPIELSEHISERKAKLTVNTHGKISRAYPDLGKIFATCRSDYRLRVDPIYKLVRAHILRNMHQEMNGNVPV
jgi:hypothetical protein